MVTTTSTFSTDPAHAILHRLDVVPESHQQSLIESYEIEKTVAYISANAFNRIALQFPDHLLGDSARVYEALKERLDPKVEAYVLADTTYGSCCVDEITAAHVDADVLVHYGHSCLSRTSRLPVIYVFGTRSLTPSTCARSLLDALSQSNDATTKHHLVIFHDVAYTTQITDVVSELKILRPDAIVHANPVTETFVQPHRESENSSDVSNSNFSEPGSTWNTVPSGLDGSDLVIFYIGPESLALNNILLANAETSVYSYDPALNIARHESPRTNKLLMRRYAILQKARDADVFGILVGTLGVASYLPLMTHLRKRLKETHRKVYTISVGKLNPAKLANFPEIECYVLVACPENSIIDSKDFSTPIITPYELELALQPEPVWTGKIVLDFGEVMKTDTELTTSTSEKGKEKEEMVKDKDEPQFSLVTGKYKSRRRYGDVDVDDLPEDEATDVTKTPEQIENAKGAIALRSKENALAKMSNLGIGEYLKTRTYQGLDPRIGQDAPGTLEKGRTGIASGYDDDHPPVPPSAPEVDAQVFDARTDAAEAGSESG